MTPEQLSSALRRAVCEGTLDAIDATLAALEEDAREGKQPSVAEEIGRVRERIEKRRTRTRRD